MVKGDTMLDTLPDLIQKIGFPGAILVVLVFGIWRISKSVAYRLFDDKVGYVTMIVADHRHFLSNLTDIMERQQNLIESIYVSVSDHKIVLQNISDELKSERLVHRSKKVV